MERRSFLKLLGLAPVAGAAVAVAAKVGNAAEKPEEPQCVYESRPYYGFGNHDRYLASHTHSYAAASWCRTHGWDCPNTRRG